jgi:hypothetical protein
MVPNCWTERQKYLGIFAHPIQDGFIGSRHFELWDGLVPILGACGSSLPCAVVVQMGP